MVDQKAADRILLIQTGIILISAFVLIGAVLVDSSIYDIPDSVMFPLGVWTCIHLSMLVVLAKVTQPEDGEKSEE